MNKILSISIAAYNVEKCINDAIMSLIKDKDLLNEIEIIIVNDGSKDRTSQIAHDYADKYPESVLVIDKENGGYGSTINASLAIARGKYYKLLDGDDWYSTDNLHGFIEFLDSASADLIVTPYYQIKGNEESLVDEHREIGNSEENLKTIHLNNHTFLMHEITINTERLREINQPIAEKCFYTDLEFVYYAIACANSIARYDKPIYCYQLGIEGQSVSLTGIRKHYRDFSIVARRMFSFYEEQGSFYQGSQKAILEKAICDYTYHTYHAYLVLENSKEMKKELIEFDKEIKQSYPKAYSIGFSSRLVWCLRRSYFLLFSLLSKKSQ